MRCAGVAGQPAERIFCRRVACYGCIARQETAKQRRADPWPVWNIFKQQAASRMVIGAEELRQRCASGPVAGGTDDA